MIHGSNIAKEIDLQYKREQRYRQLQFEKKYCNKCKNFNTNLCNITIDINRNLKCVNFIKVEDGCEMVEKGLCLGCVGLSEKDWERERKV